LTKANLTKVRDAKPRVFASSAAQLRIPRSPGCRTSRIPK
jgi:hypothetical protein